MSRDHVTYVAATGRLPHLDGAGGAAPAVGTRRTAVREPRRKLTFTVGDFLFA